MGGDEPPKFSFRNNFIPPKNEPRVPLNQIPVGKGQEFGLFPWEWFRNVPDYVRFADPGPNRISPWARRDAYKWHPFFSLKNRFRHFIPGLEWSIVAFAAYVAYDQWYTNYGPGKEETDYWKNWMKERNQRLGLDHHGHGHDGHGHDDDDAHH
ncbi:hypothetical protein HK097_006129 [Rhizophlyctis rosea]|uniref:NADH dehydrogenase [ubiquinone] 1 beta subcomplex subunit 3 n=1 Tax=Rhizophlyctis rosea TaxID=64517 RepID=A0AAD5WWK8_9FUNG|nr:hypothetical protein HK097_006129 [Rhizophlyctis rosea]